MRGPPLPPRPGSGAGIPGPALTPCPRRRHRRNRDTAQELLGRLRDNWELQRFLQDGQEVSVGAREGRGGDEDGDGKEDGMRRDGMGPGAGWSRHGVTAPSLLSRRQLALWIDEKMLTAQDVSYEEARNLHTKWQKHQAFAAELAANKGWLEKMEKVGPGCGRGAGTPSSPPPPR